jgi:hypothetical protein
MPNGMRWVGLYVHAHARAVAVFDDVTGEVMTRRVGGRCPSPPRPGCSRHAREITSTSNVLVRAFVIDRGQSLSHLTGYEQVPTVSPSPPPVRRSPRLPRRQLSPPRPGRGEFRARRRRAVDRAWVATRPGGCQGDRVATGCRVAGAIVRPGPPSGAYNKAETGARGQQGADREPVEPESHDGRLEAGG